MNHTTTVSFYNQWIPSIQAAHDANALFYMGETGSVSCHGEDGVSNTMGAALWELDYVLNGAVLGMDGIFFHMGTPFFYSMWQPVAWNGTAARVYPTSVTYCLSPHFKHMELIMNPRYNALIVIAVTLSNFESPYVASVPSPSGNPNVAIYAIYSAKPTAPSTAPSKLILLNLNYYPLNSTSLRPTETVSVADILESTNLRVARFTAAGADAVSGATFGGQSWENGGVVSGTKVYEQGKGGAVEVGDSEGVVVEVI
jgi:hypothetical protein